MKMTQNNFGLLYVMLVICQIILCNFTHLGPYIMLTMLPVMVLCIPTGTGAVAAMIIAFFSGLSVDWISEGLLGLNAASLVPVALLRKPIIRLFLGEDIIIRNDSFSIRKNGLGKVSLALATSITIFLFTYIFLDGAGVRPMWFCLSRFAASLACNIPLGIIAIKVLVPDERK